VCFERISRCYARNGDWQDFLCTELDQGVIVSLAAVSNCASWTVLFTMWVRELRTLLHTVSSGPDLLAKSSIEPFRPFVAGHTAFTPLGFAAVLAVLPSAPRTVFYTHSPNPAPCKTSRYNLKSANRPYSTSLRARATSFSGTPLA
jgi:hypothetical protein